MAGVVLFAIYLLKPQSMVPPQQIKPSPVQQSHVPPRTEEYTQLPREEVAPPQPQQPQQRINPPPPTYHQPQSQQSHDYDGNKQIDSQVGNKSYNEMNVKNSRYMSIDHMK